MHKAGQGSSARPMLTTPGTPPNLTLTPLVPSTSIPKGGGLVDGS
jgi:hypothetical protein